MNKAAVSKFIKNAQGVVTKKSPEILIGMGIAGMVTTVILAVKATPKAIELKNDLDHIDSETCEVVHPTKTEVVKTCWKCYIPAAVTGVASIACLIGSNSVSTKRNAALAAAYTLSDTTLREYKDKVIETIGEKKEQVVQDKIAKEKVEQTPATKTEVIITEKGNSLCFDYISGRYFKSDIDRIKKTENEINKRLRTEMYISLNEFYAELGLSSIGVGDDLGWNIDSGDVDIVFSSQIADDGTPCIVINYLIAPRYDYMNLH